MAKTLLLSFDDSERMQTFVRNIENLVDKARGEGSIRTESIELILGTLDKSVQNPPIKTDDERICSLFVCGEMVNRGCLADLNKKFDHEIGLHSGSVEIREDTGNGWVVLRSRMRRNA